MMIMMRQNSDFTILLHSSKTMKIVPQKPGKVLRPPPLIEKAEVLGAYLKTLSPAQLSRIMRISPTLAAKTHRLIANWDHLPQHQSPAIDSFVGDIYSGLQANQFSEADRKYADAVLHILSGLYGIVRPLDGICPYRLEMAYKLPEPPYANLYQFWGETIAQCIPKSGPIINLAAVEYSKTIIPFVNPTRVITPHFLTKDGNSGEPTFVVVHAKIARGAFARWLIIHRITNIARLKDFKEIGYAYDPKLSTPEMPTFVCQTFKGKGLSMRLS